MKPLILILALAVLFVFSLAMIGGTSGAQTKPEYKLELDCSEKKMNARAAEGWQLVGIAATSYNGTPSTQCAFKRQ